MQQEGIFELKISRHKYLKVELTHLPQLRHTPRHEGILKSIMQIFLVQVDLLPFSFSSRRAFQTYRHPGKGEALRVGFPCAS